MWCRARSAAVFVAFSVAASGCGGNAPADPGGLPVTINGPWPAGTRTVHASFVPDSDYCSEWGDPDCSQVWQVSFPPPAATSFRIEVPGDATRLLQNTVVTPKPKLALRIEARGDDQCVLARGTRPVDLGTGSVSFDLTPPAEPSCLLIISVEGEHGTSVSFNGDSCPHSGTSSQSVGVVCVTELRKGTAMDLRAGSTNSAMVFNSWNSVDECNGSGLPACALSGKGPAILKARFRAP